MSEETLKIVIPVFTAILGLFVGYFLNQALYERKRKDDLADRDFNRRVAIHETRIKNARFSLDRLHGYISLYEGLIIDMIFSYFEEDKIKSFNIALDKIDDIDEISLLTKGTNKSSFIILNDKELLDLEKELSEVVFPMYTNFLDTSDKFTDDDISETVFRDGLKAFSRMVAKASGIITKMKIRLDELDKGFK